MAESDSPEIAGPDVRVAVRDRLWRYIRAVGIGTPTLALQISRAANYDISARTMHNFMVDAHRVNDVTFKHIRQFAMSLPPEPPEADPVHEIGRGMAVFFKDIPPLDYAGRFVNDNGSSEMKIRKDHGYLRVVKTDMLKGEGRRRIHDGAMAQAPSRCLLMLRDRLSGEPRLCAVDAQSDDAFSLVDFGLGSFAPEEAWKHKES